MTQSPSVSTVDSNQRTEENNQGIRDKDKICIACGFVLLAIAIIVGLISLIISMDTCQSTGNFCPDDWIGVQNKCYYFSEEEGDWNSSRYNCTTRGADLTMIDTTEEMNFLRRYKCTSDHWIGLEMTENQTLRWVNGTISKIWFPVRGNGKCAYLDNDGVATARCYTDRKWICRKKLH